MTSRAQVQEVNAPKYEKSTITPMSPVQKEETP
jgi:hypothetical protein